MRIVPALERLLPTASRPAARPPGRRCRLSPAAAALAATLSLAATPPVLALPVAAAAGDLVHADSESALRMLADVAYRADVEGIELARERLASLGQEGEPPETAARRQYLVALADWHLSMVLGAAGDPEGSMRAAHSARRTLEEAIRLDSEMAAAYALLNRVIYGLVSQGALEQADGMARFLETRNKALELAPDAPLTQLTDAVLLLYTPPEYGGDPEKGLEQMRAAVATLEAAAPEDAHAAIWLPVVRNFQGTFHLGRGEIAEARRAFEAALAVRPDYTVVRTTLLPMTERVDPVAIPASLSTGWHELASDAEADGRFPGLPDLRRLEWLAEPKTRRIWFRLSVAEPFDTASFGANLALDLDDDQATGSSWWASTGFTYDRLVTVWVARGEDGRYRGTAGVADAAEVARGVYASESRRDVAFAVDSAGPAILVGVHREDLGPNPRIRAVGTVGSNTTWSDSAPDEGSSLLLFEP